MVHVNTCNAITHLPHLHLGVEFGLLKSLYSENHCYQSTSENYLLTEKST